MRSCLLSDNFPPQKGGIATWMHALADTLSQSDDVVAITEDRPGANEFDRSRSFQIIREKPEHTVSFLGFVASSMTLFLQLLRRSASAQSEAMYLKDVLQCIGILSGKQMVYLIKMLAAIATAEKASPFVMYYCGKVIPSGLIAFFSKFVSGTPYIVIVHGAEFLFFKNRKNTKKQMMAILNYADGIIANSRYTRDLILHAGIEAEKISIVHPGTDPEIFNPEIETRELKTKLGLDSHNVILTIANLEVRKGHDRVLQALAIVQSEIADIKYVIVGDGRNRERLQTLAQQLCVSDSVIFVGTVPDDELPAYYNACDIFVMPNRQIDYDVEGFGISFIEASACGKPVIGGNSGGVQDAIIDGVTGYLVDPENETELAEKITALLKDEKLAHHMGAAGRARVEKELTWKTSAKKIRQIAEDICHTLE